jgi:hypothetical protein
MKLDRELVLGLSFVFLSLGATVYLYSATANYVLLWPALGQLQARVDGVALAPSAGSTPPALTVMVTATNPSSYSGIKLAGAMVRVYFFAQQNPNLTLFAGPSTLTGDVASMSQFGPHTTFNATINVSISNGQAADLSAFFNAENRMVLANVLLTVELITFLDSVTGHFAVTDTENATLTLT